MWTINQMEQFSPFGGVLEMSHREEPRSGRGCFGAVVVVPFLALGGMFALIALTGSPVEAPLAAPPPARPSAPQWWTEPFETGVSLATVTETVVAEGAAREVRAARMATQTRVVGTTVTETVRVSGSKPAAAGRNEPGEPEEEEPASPPSSDSASPPVVTTSVQSTVSSVEPPPVEAPVSTVPPVDPPAEVPPSTPRAEDPVPPVTSPVTTPVAPPCDRTEPPSEESGEEPVVFPAEDLATSSAPLAGV
ncbi:hypothetical protein SAMN04488564_110360 [Lentzea waywayandensis]|uniref:Uncharacterized protein n=1 Tax=Lentzea waywayandensis TaxID=84724 RepID=A0A1I6FAZ2_9PSEU|nr:hypothetical protein SAMN04488564_110360 [Lentzea waywayandensis]